MYKLIAIGLVGVWFLGFITAHTLGGWLHVFILVSMVLLTMRMNRERKKPIWVPLSPRRLNCIKSFPYHSKIRE